MANEDGNRQDMSVLDTERPSLAATEEAQDLSTLNPIIVPMPAFTNPNNVLTQSGSINLDLDEHPVEHSEDFGANYRPRDTVLGPADEHSRDMGAAAEVPGDPGRREAAAKTPQIDLPENRDEWQKKHWQARARQLGLPTSGNIDDVQMRVEEQEGVEEEYASYDSNDWKKDIEAAETEDDLAELRGAYDRSGSDYSTVVAAFDAKQAELAES